MKKKAERKPGRVNQNAANWAAAYKEPAPRDLVPTELGSAVFAAVDGQPPDEAFLVLDPKQNKASE